MVLINKFHNGNVFNENPLDVDFYKYEKRDCPVCFGTGKLRAMQSAVALNGESIRYKDTMIDCGNCDNGVVG